MAFWKKSAKMCSKLQKYCDLWKFKCRYCGHTEEKVRDSARAIDVEDKTHPNLGLGNEFNIIKSARNPVINSIKKLEVKDAADRIAEIALDLIKWT